MALFTQNYELWSRVLLFFPEMWRYLHSIINCVLGVLLCLPEIGAMYTESSTVEQGYSCVLMIVGTIYTES